MLKITSEIAKGEGLCDSSVRQYSGYFYIGPGDKKYFFWFFESRNSPMTDPTVMWLTGGPGCSSQLALFVENGPCKVRKDGKSTENNPFSWNTKSNIFWIDQPPGTGFSEGDYDTTEEEVAEDMFKFLQTFFKTFPQYNRDFFVFGESYAGHYIPAITHKVFLMNKDKTGRYEYIDLKGMGIGNGLTDPEEQYKWYPDMAYKSGTAPSVISEVEYEAMLAVVPLCISAIRACNVEGGYRCNLAMVECNVAMFVPYQSKNLNPYDMRKECGEAPLCYDFSEVATFLNRPEVQEQLGVHKYWEECNFLVNLWMQQDFLRNFHQLIPQMLEEGLRVLVYAGDVDFICNWIGNKHWTLELDWSGKEGFAKAQDKPVVYGEKKQPLGLLRTFDSFSFLQVYQAGHMVPMDKPEESLYMFNSFLSNQLSAEESVDLHVTSLSS